MSNSTSKFSPSLILVLLVVFLVGSFSGGIVGAKFALQKNKTGTVIERVVEKENGVSEADAKKIARAEEDATIAVVNQAAPAVVSIVGSKLVAKAQTQFPFGDFFGIPFNIETPSAQNSQPTEQTIGAGTGFVITEDGLIVTNKHVVLDEQAKYTIKTSDGKEYEGKVLARDPIADVAIVKIEAKGLPALSFGDSDKIRIGETVIAIGNALSEFQNTVTKGVISGVNRRVVAGGAGLDEVIEEALQTDAAINPGNSGGPLLDLDGKVIGMNTAVDRNGQSLGFSIPANTIKRIAESVQKYGRIMRPYLGVRYIDIASRPDLGKALGVEEGALILSSNNKTAIVADSPAAKAGLKERDIIVKVNASKVDSAHSLAVLLSKFNPGDKVNLTVRREGKEIQVAVTLGEFDEKAVSNK